MAKQTQTLSGPEKVAVLLMVLGEDVSSSLLKAMSPAEIRQVGVHMTQIKNVKKEMYEELLHEFTSSFYTEGDINKPGDVFFKDLVSHSLTGPDGEHMLAAVEKDKERVPFKSLREIDPRIVANTITNEHPQTIALILSHLAQDQASKVLALMPEPLQLEVVTRIANLETVPEELIFEVDEALQEGLASMGGEGRQLILGGVEVAAAILNSCDRRTGDRLLEELEGKDSELAEQIRKLMFVFEDLVMLDDKSIRELLKEVKSEDLMLALKTTSDEIRQKVFKNLSQRASQMLQEDLTAMGPVRLSDVEAAQQNILAAAKKLEQEGKIVLGGGEGGDVFV